MAKEMTRITAATFVSTLKRIPPPVITLFALAGFAAAYVGSSYSAWVAQRIAENSQSARFKVCHQDCLAQKVPRVDCYGGCEKIAYEGWYQGNLALTEYADRQWWIWALSFPAAVTLAMLVGIVLNWLPNLQPAKFLPALGLLFFSSAVAAIVMIAAAGIVWTLAPLPTAVAYAWLLTRTQKVLTERAENGLAFSPLLLAIPAGALLGGLLHLILPDFAWFSGAEILWAILFGGSLAIPTTIETAT
jgi:hypothetical protein